MKKTQHGFTLVELMIAVVVVSILASIAVPAYSNYVTRGKVTEAFNNLTDLRVRLEQYYQDNRNYGTGSCGTDAVPVVRVAMPTSPAATYFTYTCAMPGGDQFFTVTASGVAGSSTASFSYTINQSNTKTSTTPWGNSTSCWITKPGGTC